MMNPKLSFETDEYHLNHLFLSPLDKIKDQTLHHVIHQ